MDAWQKRGQVIGPQGHMYGVKVLRKSNLDGVVFIVD